MDYMINKATEIQENQPELSFDDCKDIAADRWLEMLADAEGEDE
jgi:hypothetical protein